jgi:predicted TIM-barrel fold metal-dependent hydrolase
LSEAQQWPVTDGQIHVWAASTPERPWPVQDVIKPQREVPLGLDEVRAEMDRAGVGRVVLVPPMWEGPRNDLALAAAVREPNRFAVMGRLDTTSHESLDALRTWRSTPGMIGARCAFNRGDKRAQLQRAEDVGFFAAAQEAGVPLMIFSPGLMQEVGGVAERYPQLRIIIDHLALDETDRCPDPAPLVEPVRQLARFSNVAVKLSALPCFVSEPPGFDVLRPIVYDMIDRFGAERAFWGSDLSRLPCPYKDLVDFFAEGLPQLSAAERQLVLGEGICRWLDWPIE